MNRESEIEKLGQRLRDRTGEWKLALHERDEYRADVVRLRTALREADEVFSGYTMASVTYDVDRMRLIVRAALGEDE